MVAPAERRAPRGRVMAVVAPVLHPATAAVAMRLAAAVAAGMHPAVEAVAIPAVVAVTPVVEDIPATAKRVVAS
jgi:hypothetical protein